MTQEKGGIKARRDKAKQMGKADAQADAEADATDGLNRWHGIKHSFSLFNLI